MPLGQKFVAFIKTPKHAKINKFCTKKYLAMVFRHLKISIQKRLAIIQGGVNINTYTEAGKHSPHNGGRKKLMDPFTTLYLSSGLFGMSRHDSAVTLAHFLFYVTF